MTFHIPSSHRPTKPTISSSFCVSPYQAFFLFFRTYRRLVNQDDFRRVFYTKIRYPPALNRTGADLSNSTNLLKILPDMRYLSSWTQLSLFPLSLHKCIITHLHQYMPENSCKCSVYAFCIRHGNRMSPRSLETHGDIPYSTHILRSLTTVSSENTQSSYSVALAKRILILSNTPS